MASACIANILISSKFSALAICRNSSNWRHKARTWSTPQPHALALQCTNRNRNSGGIILPRTRRRIIAKAKGFADYAEEEEEDDDNDNNDEDEAPEAEVEEDNDDEGFGKFGFEWRTDRETAAAYEARYGPAYSGVSVLGNDVYELGRGSGSGSGSGGQEEKEDEFEESVVHVRRVCKVIKGGQRVSYRAVVVVGDRNGRVGVGKGNALEIIDAVRKSALNARKNLIRAPITKNRTFPHRAEGRYNGATVMLRPAVPGSGLRAGNTVRTVLELAGYENALGKQLRTRNHLNNARATIVALSKMMTFREASERRGIPMEELWK